ncbi:hypothetical protein Trydic_g1824 [Trypoxylus dichotomus]
MNRRSRKPQSLQIAFWNANGLTTKKTELEEFVQRHQLDAILIGETHLTASNRLTLPNFRVYRSNREDPRGRDTAILVKSTIEHHADLALDPINIVATAVTVNLATGPVKLVAAYKVPRRQLLEEIFDTRGAVIVAGDLNAKHPSWNSRRPNASGICLRRFADELHLLVNATAEPTIFPHNGQPDVLDIVVMKCVVQFDQLTVLDELSSDHNPVLLQLGQAASEDEEPWTCQTVSWPAFADHLSTHIGPITAIGSKQQYAKVFIPREVRDLIREKNRLRRQWQRTLNPASKAEYNRMARRTKVALDEFRNNRWGDFMVRASETPSRFWKVIKVVKRERVPITLIHGARGVAFTTEEDEEPIRPTSPEEVKAIVKSFRPNKAAGPDGITYQAPRKFVMHMTNICNAILRLRHFPFQWKLADVAMIPKPGRSHKWRKTTGPSTAGGNGGPRPYLRLPIRIPQRAQHHSPGAAHRQTHKRGLQPTGMHRSGIARRRQRLRQGLAPGPTPEDAPFSARGPSKTSWKDGGPQRGRPQQAQHWIHYGIGTQSGESPSIPAVLFAIGDRQRRRYGNAPDLTFQGGIIHWQREVKYLGVTLDSHVNWAAHIHRVLDCGRQMLGTLYPMMVGRRRLDPSLKVWIYKIVLRPAITYACAVWETASPTHIRKLEAF